MKNCQLADSQSSKTYGVTMQLWQWLEEGCPKPMLRFGSFGLVHGTIWDRDAGVTYKWESFLGNKHWNHVLGELTGKQSGTSKQQSSYKTNKCLCFRRKYGEKLQMHTLKVTYIIAVYLSILRTHLWWNSCTLYLHACHVRVAVGDSGLCCCVCVASFER